MRHRIVPAIIAMMLLLVSVHGNVAWASSEESYAIVASNKAPKVGEEFTVTVHGEKLEDLYGYEVKLNYSPMKLQLIKATNAIGDGFSVPPIVKDGMITFAFTKIGASTKGLSGSSDMVQFTFKSIEKGRSDVRLLSVKTVNSLKAAQAYSLSQTVDIHSLLKASFTDVNENNWAYASIMRAAGTGMVSGYPDGTFRPQSNITRAEFVTMLSRALELPKKTVESSSPFKDSSEIGAWAMPNVELAVQMGWISGYQDGTFKPNQMINRTEMTVIAARALGLHIENPDELRFSDVDQIPAWARPYISRASEIGLIKGRGNHLFVPLAHTTRAEAVSVMLRVFELKAQE